MVSELVDIVVASIGFIMVIFAGMVLLEMFNLMRDRHIKKSEIIYIEGIKDHHIMGTDIFWIQDTNLWYDIKTRIVYYVMFTREYKHKGTFGLMSPYYSKNGRLCRYVDDKIEEID